MSNIKDFFPQKVYIKDWNVSKDFLKKLSNELSFLRMIGVLHFMDGTRCCFTEEIINKYPNVNTLYNMFLEGFSEYSYEYDSLNFEIIKNKLQNSENRFFHYNYGDNFPVHDHNRELLFGIFYFDDCINEFEGGELEIMDPITYIYPKHYHHQSKKIKTKAGRMIIGPGYMPHSVSKYKPSDKNRKRNTFVVNLSL